MSDSEPASPVRTCTVRFVMRRNPLTRDFGLALQPRDGVHFVTVVEEASEADHAGIRVGDGVFEVNGKSPPLDSVAALLPPRGSDEYVTFTVRRVITSRPATAELAQGAVAQEAAHDAAEHDLAAAHAATAARTGQERARLEASDATRRQAASASASAPPPTKPLRPEATQSSTDRVAQTLSRAASETFNFGFLKEMLKCGTPRGKRASSTLPDQQSGVSG